MSGLEKSASRSTMRQNPGAGGGIDPLPPLRAELRPESRLYLVALYEQSLTFYLQRRVTPVAYRDEFDFWLQQQPELGIPTIPAFVHQWRADAAAGRPALALIRTDLLAELRRQGLAIRVVAADERRAVIATR